MVLVEDAAMDREQRKAAYNERYLAGPFPNRVDPWAERGYYFHQLHGAMIGELMRRLRDPLLDTGYIATREVSLQISRKGQQSDLAIRRRQRFRAQPASAGYSTLAAKIEINPGTAIEWDMPELDALFIKRLSDGILVTVVEIISLSNKADRVKVRKYLKRREELITEDGVNIVEIDLTCSRSRLFVTADAEAYPYHIAIYLPLEPARLIGMQVEQPLDRFALPLRGEVLSVDTQATYATAYQEISASIQIDTDVGYQMGALPYPSLMTDEERANCANITAAWKLEVARLREEAREI
jgi:Protein of unknown function (DUF4058)